MDAWYFAYGSNLLKQQMLKRVRTIGPITHPPQVVRLEQYRLVFQHLKEGGPAYANILAGGEGVTGVVYRLTEAEFQKMDSYELGYVRKSVTVTNGDAARMDAVAYVMQGGDSLKMGLPSEEYLTRIVTGANEHSLQKGYVSRLVEIALGATHS